MIKLLYKKYVIFLFFFGKFYALPLYFLDDLILGDDVSIRARNVRVRAVKGWKWSMCPFAGSCGLRNQRGCSDLKRVNDENATPSHFQPFPERRFPHILPPPPSSPSNLFCLFLADNPGKAGKSICARDSNEIEIRRRNWKGWEKAGNIARESNWFLQRRRERGERKRVQHFNKNHPRFCRRHGWRVASHIWENSGVMWATLFVRAQVEKKIPFQDVANISL